MAFGLLSVFIRNKQFKILPDEELVLLFKRTHDPEVINVLFDRYMHLVFSNCLRFLKDGEMAKDATMQIFGILPEKLNKHSIIHFKSWFFRLICNHCLMGLRKNKREIITGTGDVYSFRSYSEYDEYFTNEEEHIMIQIMQNLENLCENQKVCVQMMYLQQCSYKEIALKTGFTLKQVKSFIQNGIRNLKIALVSRYEKK